MEPAFRRSLIISKGSFAIFFSHPISAAFIVVALIMLILPLVTKKRLGRVCKRETDKSGERMKTPDRWSSLFWLFFSIFICIESYRLGIGSFSVPGTGFFHFLVGIVFAMLSLLLFIQTFMKEGQTGGILERVQWRVSFLPCLSVHLCHRFGETWIRGLNFTLYYSHPGNHRTQEVAYCYDYRGIVNSSILRCFPGLASIPITERDIGFVKVSRTNKPLGQAISAAFFNVSSASTIIYPWAV